jgi:hypothetical protein
MNSGKNMKYEMKYEVNMISILVSHVSIFRGFVLMGM